MKNADWVMGDCLYELHVFIFTASSYEVSLRMNQDYNSALDDPTSAAYISLKNDVETVVSTENQEFRIVKVKISLSA